MGLAGLGSAWRVAVSTLGAPPIIGEGAICFASAVFAILCVAYVLKAIRNWPAVEAEYRNATTAAYFGTPIIAAQLLASGVMPYSVSMAKALWAVATVCGWLLLVALCSHCISSGVPLAKVTPAWLIPIISNAAAANTGITLGFREVSIASFGIAVCFYVILLPLLFYRLIFTEPLPAQAAPSLSVLVASPAVLSIAVYQISDGAGVFFDALVADALFSFVLVVSLWRMVREMSASATMWAYAFSAAELAGAVLRYQRSVPSDSLSAIAIFVLGLATLVTAIVAVCSIRIMRQRAVA
jgi:tellurite resistance protein